MLVDPSLRYGGGEFGNRGLASVDAWLGGSNVKEIDAVAAQFALEDRADYYYAVADSPGCPKWLAEFCLRRVAKLRRAL